MRARRVAWICLLLVSCSTASPKESALPSDPFLARLTVDKQKREVLDRAALRGFRDCDEVVAYFRSEASHYADQISIGHHGWSAYDMGQALSGSPRRVPQAVPMPQMALKERAVAGSAAEAFSTTNVQEENVDEPDTVKTDGKTLYYARGNTIFATSLAGGVPSIVDSLEIKDTSAVELLLAGDRLVAIHTVPSGVFHMSGRSSSRVRPWRGETTVRVIDVSDPADLRIVDTTTLEGSYLSARMVNGIIRFVLRTDGTPLATEYPKNYSEKELRRVATVNRKRIKSSGVRDWLPRYRKNDDAEERLTTKCDDVRRPARFSGLGMINVLTLDPVDPKPRDAATIVGAGEIVYASDGTLYVTSLEMAAATNRRSPSTISTKIHAFDISKPEAARYVASGEVSGSLLSQWSLSEHDGKLRVASTAFDRATTVSRVDVLERDGPLLKVIGGVGGLGKTERIYAVRFIGELGYVVTFRQTDPLYVIDISDPKAPRVRGALKIPGYSAYLHPVDEGRLLGVGQDADTNGRTLGVQVSSFDVSNLDKPKQISKAKLGRGNSPVEHDHHAFLWWAAERIAVVPMFSYTARGVSSDVVVVKVAADGTLHKRIRLRQPGSPTQGFAQIDRVVVVGDRLLTLSNVGLMASDLDSFARKTWLPWS